MKSLYKRTATGRPAVLALVATAMTMAIPLAMALALPTPALASGDAVTWSLGTFLHTVVEPAVKTMTEWAEHGSPGKLAGEAFEVAGQALKVGEVAAKIVTELGYDVTVDTAYEPEDGPVAIHLQDDHTKDLSDRSIVLKAKVEFKNDWESKLPAATARKIVGLGLPEKGVAKHALVNWYFPDKLWRYVTVLPGDFTAGTNPTFSSKTDAEGVAEGKLHPVKEDFLFGGVKRVEEVKIKAVARVQAQDMPHGLVSAVAPLVDMALQAAQGTGVVRIERHVPTEWEGSFILHRSIAARWSVSRARPQDRRPLFCTLVTGGESWRGTLSVPKMRFTTKGLGSGDYDYDLTAEQTIEQVSKGEVVCDNGRELAVTEKFSIRGKGEGAEYGKGSASLVAKGVGDGKLVYAMSWTGAAGTSAIIYPKFSGRTSSTRTWTDCDGSHNITAEGQLHSRYGLSQRMILSGPITPKQQLWLAFDPNATKLVGSVTWKDSPDLGADAPVVTISTTMSWNIRRIIPPPPAAVAAGK